MVVIQAFDWRTVDERLTPPSKESSQEEKDAWKEQPRGAFLIDVYGVTEDSHTVSARIHGFRPYFYVELPCKRKLSVVAKHTLLSCFQDLMRNSGDYALKHTPELLDQECKQVARLRFGGYQWNRKRRFLKLVFSTERVRKKMAQLLLRGGVPVQDDELHSHGFKPFHHFPVYESNVEPLLRFFHEREINPTGWIEIPEDAYTDADLKETEIDIECEDWKAVHPEPSRTSIGPVVLCSFDIEADSSHGDFPLAKKTYTKLANQIVDVFIERHLGVQAVPLTCTTVHRWLCTAFDLGSRKAEGISRVHVKWDRAPPAEFFSRPRARAEYESDKMCDDYAEVLIARDEFRAPASAAKAERRNPHQEERGATSFLQASAAAAMRNRMDSTRRDGAEELSPESWLHQLLLRAKQQHGQMAKMQWRAYRRTLFRAVALFLDQLLLESYPVEGDSVIQIGSVFWRFGEDAPFLKHIITLDTCDAIEGCEVVSCETEKDVLREWADLIRTKSPDCLLGYNIFGFDYKFMWERAEELGCTEEFGSLSKMRNWRTRTKHFPHENCPDGLTCLRDKQPGCKLIEKELTSAGLGENFLYYMDTPGIAQIDLCKIVMRDHKLSSYKLDDVASTFIYGDVIRVAPVETKAADAERGTAADEDATTSDAKTIVWTDNSYGLSEGDFVKVLRVSSIGEDAVEEGRKFKVLHIAPPDDDGEENAVRLWLDGDAPLALEPGKYRWGIAKDDVSPQDIFKLQKGDATDRAIVAKYCVQDCVLVLHLLMKLQIITNNIGMSTVCKVPLQYIITRGQGIKTFSLVSNECRKLGYLIPVLDRPYEDPEAKDAEEEEERDGYEGAVVLPPKPGIYNDPIAVLDYSSLYPSSMISENLCHTSLVEDPLYQGDAGAVKLSAKGLEFKDISYDNYIYTRKGKTTTKRLNEEQPTVTCRFIQPQKDDDGKIVEESRGIIPRILKVVLAQRKATRKRIKTEKDPFVRDVLDGQQLALKVSANSVYGSIGARVNPIYKKDVAACTTATGRRLLNFAKEFVTDNYEGSECIYGDTDSIFVAFRPKDEHGKPLRGKAALKRCIELGQEAGERSKPLLTAPHDLEYEKTFYPFVLFSKKRYVGNKYEFDPDKFKQSCMGIVLKRRDNARILKHVYAEVIDAILNKCDIPLSIRRLKASLRKLVDGGFPMDYLVITKSLRSHYDNPEQITHAQLAQRMGERDPGNKPSANDRIPYIYFDVGDRKVTLQGERVETPAYMAEHGLRPDYMYYITNQIAKPVSQIYALIVEQLEGYKLGAGHFERVAQRLRDEGRDAVKVRKKIEELRAKEAMRLLFDGVLRREKNRREGNQDLRRWFGESSS